MCFLGWNALPGFVLERSWEEGLHSQGIILEVTTSRKAISGLHLLSSMLWELFKWLRFTFYCKIFVYVQNFWTWSLSRKDSYSIILWVFQTPLPVKWSGLLIFLTFIECSHIMLSPFEQFYSGYYVIKQASQQAMQMLLILQGLLQMQKNFCLCLALYISR